MCVCVTVSILGYITITGSLDYESVKEYSLSVQAADGGTPSLSSTAIVIISVTDENDNPPVFVQAVYQCSIKENANLKTNLVQVGGTPLLMLIKLYLM